MHKTRKGVLDRLVEMQLGVIRSKSKKPFMRPLRVNVKRDWLRSIFAPNRVDDIQKIRVWCVGPPRNYAVDQVWASNMNRNMHAVVVKWRCLVRKKALFDFKHGLALEKSIPIRLNEMVRRSTRMRENRTFVPILRILEFVLQVHEIVEVFYEIRLVVIIVFYRQSWREHVSALVMLRVKDVE